MMGRDEGDRAADGVREVSGHSIHEVRPESFNYVWDNSIEPALK
jgi:hypothetical protein